MVRFIRKHIAFLIMTTVLLIQIALLIVTSILSKNVQVSEFFTRTFVRGYVNIFGKVNEKLNFSLTEFSFIVVIVSCFIYIAWGFCLLRNKNPWGLIHRLMMVTLIIVGGVTMYNLTAGMEYNREALPVKGYQGEIKKEEFVQIATYFVDDYNKCAEEIQLDEQGEIVLPYTREHLLEVVRLEFDKLDDEYYHPYVPKAKNLATSGLFTTVGIVGMYFSVLGEVNYSNFSTNTELPFYVAHEMAHSIGVMREDDAQILALQICATSDDPILRYSAYFNTFQSILNVLHYTDNKDDYRRVKSMMSPKIYDNYNYIYNHWKGKTFLYDFGNKVNDWYLKTFGQKDGTTSYDDTTPSTDPSGKIITLSRYQRIYFGIYYDKKA